MVRGSSGGGKAGTEVAERYFRDMVRSRHSAEDNIMGCAPVTGIPLRVRVTCNQCSACGWYSSFATPPVLVRHFNECGSFNPDGTVE